MLKWVVRAVTIAVIGFIGYAGYDFYRADYVNAPPLQDGDFLLSYKFGLKAVMRGMEDERQTRRYLGVGAQNVPSWYRESWSICRAPSELETGQFEQAGTYGPGSRLDGVCEIDADGDVFVRGWVVTVPKIN